MSAYLFAIIPYKSGMYISSKEPIPCLWHPILPELKGIDSEFAERDILCLHRDFLEINTCYRQSAFIDNRDGFCWIRAEVCLIAKALGASEVWYVDEIVTEEFDDWNFSFDDWVESLKNEKKTYVCELTVDVLKGKEMYRYYHDDFSDIIMEKPPRKKCERTKKKKANTHHL